MGKQTKEKMTETDAQKEKKESERNKRQERKEIIDYFLSILSLSSRLIMILGAVLIIIYCLLEGFAPDGLSFGDVFFFAYIVFVFGLIFIAGSILGIISSIWIVWGLDYKNRKGIGILHPLMKSNTALVCSTVAFFCSIAWLIILGSPRLTYIFSFFFIFGSLVFYLFDNSLKNESTMKQIASRSFFAICLILTIFLYKPELINSTLEKIGIRSHQGDIVVVSSVDRDYLIDVVRSYGFDMKFCRLPNSQKWATLDMYAVWHGIGATSYLRLLEKDAKTVLVSIPRTNLSIVRSQDAKPNCSDLDTSHMGKTAPSPSPGTGMTGEKNP